MGSISNPTAVFAEYQRELGSFEKLTRELAQIEALPSTTCGTNHFAELPDWCIFNENWARLEGFDGPSVSSLSASHQLSNVIRRETVYRWISNAVGSDDRLGIHDVHDLDFDKHRLQKAGRFSALGGWTKDPETKYRGFFVSVSANCVPSEPRSEYFIGFWNEAFALLQVSDRVAAASEGDGWFVRSKGNLIAKCIAGGFRGENPQGIALYGFEALSDVELALERLAPLGRRCRSSIFCNLSGKTYPKISQASNGFDFGWEVSATCDLSAADADALRTKSEPSTNRLPGASFSWPTSIDKPTVHFSCTFHRRSGKWWSVVDAFCDTIDSKREFAKSIACIGYEQTL